MNMRFSTLIKRELNRALRPFNARIDTLSAERRERARLERLVREGRFERPAFPLAPSFANLDPQPILREVASSFEAFKATQHGSAGYKLANNFFKSPDAEVLYAAMRLYRPRTVVEVGSGNSTRLMRQAIIDSGMECRIVAIDPDPRSDIAALVDEFVCANVEYSDAADFARRLRPGDLLLIDSSHEIKTGNDVAFLYLNLIPLLAPGVLIHIHDMFLPYEMPRRFVVEYGWPWCEQYIVQAMLPDFDVLWAGHYLERTLSDFASHFPLMGDGEASGLLLRKRISRSVD